MLGPAWSVVQQIVAGDRSRSARRQVSCTYTICLLLRMSTGLTYDVPTGNLDATASMGDDKQQKWSLGETTNGVIADVLVQ